MFADARYALRQLARSPGFALVALLSLALGIGANAAIFSIANAVLLRSVGRAEGGELVRVYRNRHSPLEYRDFAAVRAEQGTFARVAGERMTRVGRTDGPEPTSVNAALAVGDYFALLGIRPAVGRLFGAADTTAAHALQVVLAHRYWRERFGGDTAAVGRTMRLNGHAMTIVGVAPEGFTSTVLLWRPDVFVPDASAEALVGTPLAEWGGSLYTIARLAPGASRDRADAVLALVGRRVRAADPERYADLDPQAARRPMFRTGTARGIVEEMRGPTTAAAGFLLLLVGLVLLIACVNVANLLLARASTRHRELGVRVAIGASRWRLVRQLLTESLVLALAGGALGMGAAAWLTPWLARLLSSRTPEPIALDFAPDGRVLLYAVGLSALTAMIFGVAPALRASRPDVMAALKEGARAAGVGGRLRGGLVAAQVTLCTVVLAGAALFLHSLTNARVIDPGFPAAGIVNLPVDLSSRQLAPDARRTFWNALLARARALPGVQHATLAATVPLGGSRMETSVWIPVPGGGSAAREGRVHTDFNVVGDAYFRTMGIPVVRGRELAPADHAGPDAPLAVVVNETFAARAWPGRDAVGQAVSVRGPEGPWGTVVGVARDTRYNALGEETPPVAFLPWGRDPGAELVLQVRVAPGGEATVARALSVLQREMDPQLPAAEARPIARDMAVSLLPAQVGAALLGAFGALALLLASVGIYGVTAYAVAQRTREIGVRTALGASRRDVVRLVVGDATRLVGTGLGIGLLLALGLSRVLRSQLYGVGTGDPLTFAATPLVLGAVAVLASWLPARRATRLDPVEALRSE